MQFSLPLASYCYKHTIAEQLHLGHLSGKYFPRNLETFPMSGKYLCDIRIPLEAQRIDKPLGY